MLITKIKTGKFGPITIKDIPTYIATEFYFRYQEVKKRQIKLIVTKNIFNYGSNKIYSNLCRQRE